MAVWITQKHWDKCLSCYKAEKENGRRFMLVNQKGWINWREVKIRKRGGIKMENKANRSRYGVVFYKNYLAIIKDNDQDQEVVGWNKSEWEEEPEIVFSIANAIKLAYTSPTKLLELVGKDGLNLPYPN